MTQAISEASTIALLETLLKHQKLWRAAVHRDDIPAANRQVTKVWAAAQALSLMREGRHALEDLLDHPTADIRLRAAQEVIQWSADKAIPVLGRLTFEDFGAEASPDVRIEVRTSAKGSLYSHFGIRTFDRNDLIEPMRQYGVEIPYQDHEKWR